MGIVRDQQLFNLCCCLSKCSHADVWYIGGGEAHHHRRDAVVLRVPREGVDHRLH